MILCPNCKVETEENANFCSLCGEPLWDKISENTTFIKSGKLRRNEKLLTDYQQLTGIQKRKIFWQISGLVLISGIFITILIDFITNNSITWSKIPAILSLLLFINITLNTFLRNKIKLMIALSFLSVAALFFMFDIFAGNSIWEIKYGLPIILASYLTIITLILLIKKARQKGLNLIAYSMIAAGLFSIYIEGMVSIYIQNRAYIGWSIIVLISVLPITMLLLFIHYRLKKATDLKRFFHI